MAVKLIINKNLIILVNMYIKWRIKNGRINFFSEGF